MYMCMYRLSQRYTNLHCLHYISINPLSFLLQNPLSLRLTITTKMMHMTIHWSKNLTLLFTSWNTHSWIDYSLTLLACFLFSAFYQFMEERRVQIKAIATPPVPSSVSIGTPLLFKLGRSPARVAMSVLFGVNSAMGYFLMLAIMSFNGGVFLAVVLGLSVGYYVFRSGDDTVLVVDNPCACS